MRALCAAALAALLCAGATRAQDVRPPARGAAERPAQEGAADAGQKPPLSGEDAELVKQLALLERMELVQNLELFEADQPKSQRQP